jgi:hypothetical protein
MTQMASTARCCLLSAQVTCFFGNHNGTSCGVCSDLRGPVSLYLFYIRCQVYAWRVWAVWLAPCSEANPAGAKHSHEHIITVYLAYSTPLLTVRHEQVDHPDQFCSNLSGSHSSDASRVTNSMQGTTSHPGMGSITQRKHKQRTQFEKMAMMPQPPGS